MFQIGKLFHLTQVIEDLDEADRWYNTIFSPCRYYRAYMAEAVREASLLAIGDVVIEPVQVARVPGAEQSPIGKFKARFGNRLHSIAWYVDDLEQAFDALRSQNVRLVDVGGKSVTSREHVKSIKYFWTHPRDTHGPLEFARLSPEFTIDPRVQPYWTSSFWREQHPLGLTGALSITMVVRDLDAASAFYQSVLGGREVDATMRDGRRAFAVGEGTIVELVKPESKEMVAFGDGVFGMTFHVANIDRAAQFLSEKGLTSSRMEDDALIIVSPEHALGTTVAFRQVASGPVQ